MPRFLGLYATMFDKDYLFEPLTKTSGMIRALRNGLELWSGLPNFHDGLGTPQNPFFQNPQPKRAFSPCIIDLCWNPHQPSRVSCGGMEEILPSLNCLGSTVPGRTCVRGKSTTGRGNIEIEAISHLKSDQPKKKD